MDDLEEEVEKYKFVSPNNEDYFVQEEDDFSNGTGIEYGL